MRKRYIQDRETGELIPAERYRPTGERHHFIAPDYDAYKSMQTGEMIRGRAAHREHLRRHNLIEVGNEINHMLTAYKPPKPDREKRKRDIAAVLNGYGY